MKILVTGGAGFIGSNVVDSYVREGHEVVVVDNLFTGKRENLNPKARFYHMDIRSKQLRKVLDHERPEVLNHHAAQMCVPASVEDPAFDADVNILGLINILQSAVQVDCRKIIFSSTGGAIYGEADQLPTPETYRPTPLSPYAITKFASEHYLNFYRHSYDLDFTVLRYANVYGPRQVPHAEAGVVAIFMDLLTRGEGPVLYAYPEEPDGMTRDYCFVKDVARANTLALEKGENEIINIGTGRQTTTGKLYRTVLESLRRRGIALDEKFDSPQKGPARGGDLRHSSLDASKAERILGWNQEHQLEQGIEETTDAMLGQIETNSLPF